jgi:ribonuclease HI
VIPAPHGWLCTWSDGGARENPGPAGAGGQAFDEGGRLLAEVSVFLGHATNNVAEYYALILILEACRDLGFQRLRVSVDSTLVANQVKGAWRIKSQDLKPLLGRVRELLDAYRDVEVISIPREKNSECDALANKAIDEGLLGLKEPLLDTGEATLF